MKILIVGINGQDGQLIAQHLARLGHRITGIGRQPQAVESIASSLEHYCAMEVGQHSDQYSRLLDQVKPSVIFYLAAVHGSSGTQLEDTWEALQATSILGLTHSLEFARVNQGVQVINFSSSRVFGNHHDQKISEETLRHPEDLYGVVKNNADALVNFYHRTHQVMATSLILFNHESKLRGPDFFSRKLVEEFHSLSNAGKSIHNFTTLDFWKDWGLADEYMEIIACNFQRFRRPSYILATGQTIHTCQLISEICEEIGLDENAIVGPLKSRPQAPLITASPPWTAAPVAFSKDTGSTPKIWGKDVFLRLLEQMNNGT